MSNSSTRIGWLGLSERRGTDLGVTAGRVQAVGRGRYVIMSLGVVQELKKGVSRGKKATGLRDR